MGAIIEVYESKKLDKTIVRLDKSEIIFKRLMGVLDTCQKEFESSPCIYKRGVLTIHDPCSIVIENCYKKYNYYKIKQELEDSYNSG